MTQQGAVREQYIVPRYRETTAPAWYHVLHGTVPGHQIDFIYCPEVPQGPLTQTHLAHVARLIKYIEPRDQTSFAFALGNLSRDDVQHEPGHGGLALIFGLRVEGLVDHASRAMPPYAHGILAVDRALDYGVLLDAIATFHRRFLDEVAGDATGGFYRTYFRAMRERPDAVPDFLRAYVHDFHDLPQPAKSSFGADFVAQGTPPQRVTIVHANDEPFSSIAPVAAALGSVLYRSNVKWTSVSNGREIDIPGGVSVRFIPESDVPRDSKGLVLRLDEVPTDDAEIAQQLFGAKPRETGTVRRLGWREQMAVRKGAVAASVPATEQAGGRGASRDAVRSQEAVRERDSAREREPAHAPARARDGARDRTGIEEAGTELPAIAPVVALSTAPTAGAGAAVANAAAAVPDPVSTSAAAIAAALAQGVSPREEVEETAGVPSPVEAGPAAAPDVDDAAKTLAAPMRLEPEPTVDDAAATLTAPLRPVEAQSPPAVDAPPRSPVTSGGATAEVGPVSVKNAASALSVVDESAGAAVRDESLRPAAGKGRWIAIGAGAIAAAIGIAFVAGNAGGPENGSGAPPGTSTTPGASAPGTQVPAAPSTSADPSVRSTATVPAPASSPAGQVGAASSGGESAGAGSTVGSPRSTGVTGTSGTSPATSPKSAPTPAVPSPEATTPKPASTKTKTKTSKLDDTSLD